MAYLVRFVPCDAGFNVVKAFAGLDFGCGTRETILFGDATFCAVSRPRCCSSSSPTVIFLIATGILLMRNSSFARIFFAWFVYSLLRASTRVATVVSEPTVPVDLLACHILSCCRFSTNASFRRAAIACCFAGLLAGLLVGVAPVLVGRSCIGAAILDIAGEADNAVGPCMRVFWAGMS